MGAGWLSPCACAHLKNLASADRGVPEFNWRPPPLKVQKPPAFSKDAVPANIKSFLCKSGSVRAQRDFELEELVELCLCIPVSKCKLEDCFVASYCYDLPLLQSSSSSSSSSVHQEVKLLPTGWALLFDRALLDGESGSKNDDNPVNLQVEHRFEPLKSLLIIS